MNKTPRWIEERFPAAVEIAINPDLIAVYILIDPRLPDEVAYVGKAADPYSRLNLHIADRKARTEKSRWMKEMFGLGLKPRMFVVGVFDSASVTEEERRLLKVFRSEGQAKYNSKFNPDDVNYKLYRDQWQANKNRESQS